MRQAGTATVDDIHPASPTDRLSRDLQPEVLRQSVPVELASAVLGMSPAFIARALGRPGTRPATMTIEQILDLLDVDGYQETFIRRSQVPGYLISVCAAEADEATDLAHLESRRWRVEQGNARDLLRNIAPSTVQCVVTSSPYWGMRIYDNTRPIRWADEEQCPYGFEQTPEGFIRHTVELLWLLKPALTKDGSVWWNLMDTYNTRTPIRGNAGERLAAMSASPDSRRGWTEHDACRHSAGHMFLDDGEQCSIPARVAERASRIGYRLKSCITWRKHTSSPEPVRGRVTRQLEYILHLSTSRTPPLFDRAGWQQLPPELGGPHPQLESQERISDVWLLPVAQGKNGHGAEFPVSLPARCIALSTRAGDLVLDPFIGSGTTGVAALRLGRRCLGIDISDTYVKVARERIGRENPGRRTSQLALVPPHAEHATDGVVEAVDEPLGTPSEPAVLAGARSA
jgi:DNA modification methylase